ncbi:MAG: DUF86 domain-containing protein [Acidobacteria bacterium]|nr:DUF86 domain-containing protein [Acidobacteriota bacterium]
MAFVRGLEIIGKAAKQLPQGLRDQYPQISWRGFAGLRDRLIHQYFSVNYTIIWETVKVEVPELIKTVDLMLIRDDL